MLVCFINESPESVRKRQGAVRAGELRHSVIDYLRESEE
jgi:hypothetical protein